MGIVCTHMLDKGLYGVDRKCHSKDTAQAGETEC